MESKRDGYEKAEEAVLRMPRNPAIELPPSQQVPNIGHKRWATGQQKQAHRAAAPETRAGVSGRPALSRQKTVSGQCCHLPS